MVLFECEVTFVKMQVAAPKIRWLDDVVPHDFTAARTFLTLKLDEDRARQLVCKLRAVEVQLFRANDILRAAGEQPAPRSDPGVVRDTQKILSKKWLSPVLLVNTYTGVVIADGYHRVSAAYRLDPDAMVPARLG